MASRLSVFFAELKRRKVFHVAAAYVVVGFGVIEAADIILPRLALPDIAVDIVLGAILLGFPIALVLAWAYEVRPEEPERPDAGEEIAPASGSEGAVGTPKADLEPKKPGDVRSIVVLPFENLSGDPEQEFFVAGMHDALITELAQISALRVISRTSALAYKGRVAPLPEIARELNVDGVLEASVLQVGNKARIQAQLIGAFPEEHHLWAQSFDRDMTDILSMHSDVVTAVAREVQIGLTKGEEERLTTTRQVDPEIYELYLKGMFHLQKFTPEGIENGLRHLSEAVEKEPEEPLPHAALGMAWALIGHLPSPPPDALPKAREFALGALELDDSLAEAHAALGQVQIYYDWDVESAGRSYRRALELNPNLAEARAHYSWYLALLGTMEDGFEDMERARSQDPLNPAFSSWIAWQYDWAERYEEALEEARKAVELSPEFPIGNYAMGFALTGLGRFEEAIAAHEKAAAVSPMWGWGLGCTYAAMGEKERALEEVRKLEENLTTWDSWCIAEIYAWMGERDETLRWLEAAHDMRHSYIPWLNRVPLFNLVRDDPRYQDLVRRANVPA